MASNDYDLGDGAFTMPATESIDESLARLARQDARRVADGGLALTGLDDAPTAFEVLRGRAPSVDRLRRAPQVPTRRVPPAAPPAAFAPKGRATSTSPAASRPSYASSLPTTRTRPATDVGLRIVRWLLVLGLTWFVWRFFIRGL